MSATTSNSRQRSRVPSSPPEQHSERPLILEMLPIELLAIIFRFLHTESASVHAVRRTCVLFRDAAWTAFGHTFNRKVFHLWKGSLDCLSAVASMERTASYVTQLNISTVDFDALKGPWDWFEHGRDADGMRRQSVYQQHLSYTVENIRLEAQGLLREQLEQAMKGFRRLETIVVVDGEDLSCMPRWPGIQPAHQDALDEADRQGVSVYNNHAHRRTLQHLVDVSLGAGLHGKLRRLGVLATVDFTTLPSTTIVDASGISRPVFASLEVLDLHLTNPIATTQLPAARIPTFLPSFLRGCPNLTHLSIVFPEPYRSVNGPVNGQRLLSWFGEVGVSHLSDLHFPHLTCCLFANLWLQRASGLLIFLHAHSRTLRNLALRNHVMGGPYWKRFVAFLGEEMELDELELTYAAGWSERRPEAPLIGKVDRVPAELWAKAAKALCWTVPSKE